MNQSDDRSGLPADAAIAGPLLSSQNHDAPWWTDCVAVVLACAALVFNLVKHSPFFVDDAYISLRYAENLLCCGQLTWNIGEYHEGYTNFLYVLTSAGLMALGLEPVTAVRVISAVGAAALIGFVVWGARRVAPGRDMALVRAAAILTVGLTPGVAIWVLGGLEPVVLGALLTAGTVGVILILQGGLTWRSGGLAAAAFSLAVLTRMDAAVFIGASGLAVLAVTKGSVRQRFIAAFVVAGIPALVSFGHMAWRVSYYGEFFPLTFYSKTGVPLDLRLFSSSHYGRSVLRWAPAILVCVLSIALLATQKVRSRTALVLALPLLAQVLYVMWSGADHMIGARVVVPLIGAALLFMVALAAQFWPGWRIGLPGLALLGSLWFTVAQAPAGTDPIVRVARAIGAHITESWPSGRVIALHTAGAIPFYADDHTYIDMLGLVDPVIAKREEFPIVKLAQIVPGHSKGSGEYVLSRAPDIIIAGLVRGGRVEDPKFLTDVELAQSDEFSRCYALQSVEIPYDAAEAGSPEADSFTFRYYERMCEDG